MNRVSQKKQLLVKSLVAQLVYICAAIFGGCPATELVVGAIDLSYMTQLNLSFDSQNTEKPTLKNISQNN